MHIGQKIKEVVEQKGISKSELSRRLNMSSTNVHKIFKRETIDTGLLANISSILEYDFFVHLVSSSVVNDAPKAPYKKMSELLDTEKEIELLRNENRYLKEINELLREKIKMLE